MTNRQPRTVHPRSAFRRDFTYIRAILRQVEDALQRGDWLDASDALDEIAGCAATLAEFAHDNAHGVEQARYHLAPGGSLNPCD